MMFTDIKCTFGKAAAKAGAREIPSVHVKKAGGINCGGAGKGSRKVIPMCDTDR